MKFVLSLIFLYMEKIAYFLGTACLVASALCSSLFASYEDFSTTLSHAGINVQKLERQASVSRYEVARLLNAVNCEDCVVAPDWMRQKYDFNFWQVFSGLPNRDFHDINF